MSDPKDAVVMPPIRHANPVAQQVYVLYVAQVVAWFRFEAALDASRLYREDRARGPQPGVTLDLQRLAALRQELEAASAAMTASATAYVHAFQESAVPHAALDPLDMLDDVLDVVGALPSERAVAWVRSLPPHLDVQAVMTHAFAAGRYTLHRDLVRRGTPSGR